MVGNILPADGGSPQFHGAGKFGRVYPKFLCPRLGPLDSEHRKPIDICIARSCQLTLNSVRYVHCGLGHVDSHSQVPVLRDLFRRHSFPGPSEQAIELRRRQRRFHLIDLLAAPVLTLIHGSPCFLIFCGSVAEYIQYGGALILLRIVEEAIYFNRWHLGEAFVRQALQGVGGIELRRG